jgi:hypothetical protein
LFFLFVSASCRTNSGNNQTIKYKEDSALIMHYISKGNVVYAEKTGIDVFTKSMAYYDSAYQVANENGDSLLVAAAFFAKGKAYDAWNKEPGKTIEYYSAAANYYANIPSTYYHSLYLKHLVAHAYDKIHDSANSIAILADLYRIILPKPDSIKKKLAFTAEMALISTEVKNYSLAKNILKDLTKRVWIKNDTATYDYLNHYYMLMKKQKQNTLIRWKLYLIKLQPCLTKITIAASYTNFFPFQKKKLKQLYINT